MTVQGETKRQRKWKRLSDLKRERSSWDSHCRELSENIMPRQGRFLVTDRNMGTKRHHSIYDNTATMDHRTAVAGLMSNGTSPARPWFRFGVADPEMSKSQRARKWFSQCEELTFRVFRRSNTYQALRQVYSELVLFGTGVSVLMPDFENVIWHYPQTFGQYCIAQDFQGNVNALFREFEMTVEAVVHEFGLENCSESLRNQYERQNYDSWVTIVHAIEPRHLRSEKGIYSMPWASCYFEYGGGKEHDKMLREGGFDDFPVLAPRWEVWGGDIYGTSPAMEALGDIKALQLAQYRLAQVFDQLGDPALQAPAGMKQHEVQRDAGGISFVEGMGPNNYIRPVIDRPYQLQDMAFVIAEHQRRIHQAFYADLFLMLANATDTSKTATEIAERHEEKMAALGPVTDRLQRDLNEPLVTRVFQELLRGGALPPAPEELQGHELQVEFISVMAQAQKMVGLAAMDRFVTSLGVIATAKPGVLDNFDEDEWAMAYADRLGVDPSVIVPGDEVALLRAKRAEAMAAKEQAAALESVAKTTRDFASAQTSEPSALTDIMSRLTGYGGAA